MKQASKCMCFLKIKKCLSSGTKGHQFFFFEFKSASKGLINPSTGNSAMRQSAILQIIKNLLFSECYDILFASFHAILLASRRRPINILKILFKLSDWSARCLGDCLPNFF